MTLEIPAAQSVRNQNILSSKADLRSYLRFQRKKWIPKLNKISCHTTRTPKLHYLESGRGRYGAGKDGVRIRKIWTKLILWKPSSLLPQGRSRARQGGARPKAPQRHKYTPLGAQGGVIYSDPFTREPPKGDTPKEADGRRKSSRVPRRWLRPPLAAMDSLRGCAMVEFGSHPQHSWGYVRTCWWYQSTFYSSCLNFGLLQCMLSSSYVMHPYVHSMIRSIRGD
jgi:hypothetical protein